MIINRFDQWESVMGTAQYDRPLEADTSLDMNAWFSNPSLEDFRTASRNLHVARKAMAYVAPCQMDPNAWATRTEKEGGSERGRPRRPDNPRIELTPYAERVRDSSRKCSGCQVLNQCAVLLLTINLRKPITEGVIAGYLVDRSPAGVATRKALNMIAPGGQQ